MVYEYYGHNDWRDYYLSHHGVLGQKWGVRRYQPYGSGGYNPKGDTGKFVGKSGSTSSDSSGSAKEEFFSPGRRIARLTNRRTRLENRLSKTNSRLESANAKISKVENDQRRNMIKSRLAASNNQLERTIDSNTRKDKSMLRSMIEPGFVKERRAVKTERAKEQIEKNEARNRAMDSEYLNLIEQRDETAYEADRISKKIERINSKIAKLQVEQLKEQDSAEAKQKVDESVGNLGLRQYQPYGSAYSSYVLARNQRRSVNPDKYSYDKDVAQKARKTGETAKRMTMSEERKNQTSSSSPSNESGGSSSYNERKQQAMNDVRSSKHYEYNDYSDRALATELVRNGKNPSDDNIAKYRKALKKENAAYEKSTNYDVIVRDFHPEKYNEKTADRYDREYRESVKDSRKILDEMDDLDA